MRRGSAPWLVLGTLLVVPGLLLVGWWFVASTDDPTQAAAPVAAVVGPVVRDDVRPEAPVTVKLTEVSGFEATASVAGTVTTAPQVGAVLHDGVVAFEVDDRPVRAMVAAAPLWRVLEPGARGADVVRLQELLTATGDYAGPADGRFGPALRAAVARFNVAAGLGTGVTTFDPATVLWVGPQELTVTEVLTPVGSEVAPGTPVVRGPGAHGTLTVTEPQGGLPSIGEPGSVADLVVGDATVDYEPGTGTVTDPELVAAVAEALAPTTEGTATVRAREAQPVAIVPASALVQGADGTTCVYASVDADPLVVSPVGGGVGTLELPADVALDRVLVNPGLVTPRVPCSS